jgi:hypothetical protein
MLETSTWRQDLIRWMSGRLGPATMRARGIPTIALNLLKSVVAQVATLYRIPPVATNPFFETNPDSAAYFNGLKVFSRHPRLSRLTVGLRECHAFVVWTPGEPALVDEAGNVTAAATAGRVEIEVVPPTLVAASSTAASPGVPDLLSRAVELPDPKSGKVAWFWQTWDLRRPSEPRYRIVNATGKRRDRTQEFGRSGDQYEWVDPTTGRPFIPSTLYHAEDTGCLYDPDGWHELFDGTYMVAMFASFFTHVMNNASWKQAVGINVNVRGGKATGDGDDQSRHVTADPSSILMFDGDESASISMLDTPADPGGVVEAIIVFADWVLSQVGMRAAAGNNRNQERPESGMAITVRGDSLVKTQQAFVEQFRAGDLQLLKVVAQVSNALGGPLVPPLPSNDWSIWYPAAPVTRDELVVKLDGQLKEVAENLRSRVDMLMEREPGLTRPEAIERLRRNAEENRIGVAALPGEAGPVDPDADPDADTDTDTAAATEIEVNEISLAIQRLAGTGDVALINDLRRALAAKLGVPYRGDIALPDETAPAP